MSTTPSDRSIWSAAPCDAAAWQRPLLWRDITAGLLLFGAYLLVDLLHGSARRAAADRNGRALVRLEQLLHADIEHPLNHWLTSHSLLAQCADYEYAFGYIVTAIGLLGWLYLRRPSAFAQARDSMLALNAFGIICFALFPVTPPRLLPGYGYVDTVVRGHTRGSWGSSLVTGANQLAAMPSLHVAWALWVGVVVARTTTTRSAHRLGAAHVLLTLYVILATGNHYLVDAVGAMVAVGISVWLVDRWYGGAAPGRIPPNDAFFLHAEVEGAPQHVGGIAILDDLGPSLEQVRALVRAEIGGLPRFRQRPDASSRRRRPHWIDADSIDWDWHVSERVLTTEASGMSGMCRTVADLTTEAMPRDRPLWRIVMIRDLAAGRGSLVVLVHHAVADGPGVVIQALHLLRPRIGPTGDAISRRPGRLHTTVGVAAGLVHLATDGRPRRMLPPGSARREFATVSLDLSRVRDTARSHRVRVTDIALCLVAGALVDAHPELIEHTGGQLRVAVPLTVRKPDESAEGNVTAAVMIDIPLIESGIGERLRRIHAAGHGRYTPNRPLASRFIMAQALRLLPEPAVGWFARTVYGPRFFQAIVSNMVGPDRALSFVDSPVERVFPILPLPPNVPLAAGMLSWNGVLGIGLATDPDLLDATKLADGMTAAFDELAGGLRSAWETTTPTG